MASKFRFVLMVTASLLVLAACKAALPAATPTGAPYTFPITITDDAGRVVTLSHAPQRIVSLAPSNTEILYALGLGDQIVAVTDYCDYPEEAKSKPKVGGFPNFDMEKVVELNPDLVLATTLYSDAAMSALAEKGIATVVIEPRNIDETLDRIELVGRITGRAQEAAALVSQLRQRVEAVKSKVKGAREKPRVFFELDNLLFSPGPGSFIDDMITEAGGVNIAADAQGQWVQLSQETLIVKDPEVIILSDAAYGETVDKVKARDGWKDIAAVRNNRIVEVADPNLVSRPGPRSVEGFELIAKALHPELFEK